jgi:hypothetical protein
LAGGLNLYGFAGGDPINFSDPFGLCTPWPECASEYWEDAAVSGHQRGGVLGNLKAAGATLMATLIDFAGVNEASAGMDAIADGEIVTGSAALAWVVLGNLPGGNTLKVTANLRRTTKAAQGAEVTVDGVGRFVRARWSVPGARGGASRADWTKIIGPEGETVRLFKDSFDKAGRFEHRKFKFPD